jgi:hypothetical protein
MSTDLWTCGLELRSAYGVNQGVVVNQQQEEAAARVATEHKKKINEAKRIVAEAARVLDTLL